MGTSRIERKKVKSPDRFQIKVKTYRILEGVAALQPGNKTEEIISKENGDYGKRVISALLELGLSPKFKGFCHVLAAIVSYHQNPAQSISKDIYPAISRTQRRGVSPAQVERNIRSVVQAAWKNRDEAVWARFFQDLPYICERRPTNLEFISQIAWRMECKSAGSDEEAQICL